MNLCLAKLIPDLLTLIWLDFCEKKNTRQTHKKIHELRNNVKLITYLSIEKVCMRASLEIVPCFTAN